MSRHVEALRERSRGDRKWHIEGYALGSKEGSLPINVMVSDQFSSFLEPDHGRVSDYAGLNVPSHTETVAVRTLDGVLPALQERIGFERPYLKIDTQGFDIEVLRGAADSLPAVQGAADRGFGDRHLQGHAADTWRPSAISTSAGFDITGLYPMSRDSVAAAGRVRLRHDQSGGRRPGLGSGRSIARRAGRRRRRRRTCWAAPARAVRGCARSPTGVSRSKKRTSDSSSGASNVQPMRCFSTALPTSKPMHGEAGHAEVAGFVEAAGHQPARIVVGVLEVERPGEVDVAIEPLEILLRQVGTAVDDVGAARAAPSRTWPARRW